MEVGGARAGGDPPCRSTSTSTASTSRLFKAAVREIAPVIEDRGIDEIYIDLSELPGAGDDGGRAIGIALKAAVRERTGPTCSIGITPNKLLSKLASELDKPDGLTLLGHADVPARIWPLAARKVNGIGPKAAAKLASLGIETIGDVAAADPAFLLANFGKSFGAWLHEASHGRDERPVVTASEPESISRETTFDRDLHAVRDRLVLGAIFTELCEGLAGDLARKSYAAKTIGIKLRFDDFRIATRALTLPAHTLDARAIRRAAGSCLKRVDLSRRLRLIGVRAGALARLADLVAPLAPNASEAAASVVHEPIRRLQPAAFRRRVVGSTHPQRTPAHGRRHPHRRPARARRAARAAHVLRLRRLRLLDREHLPRQRERLPEDQAAPARRRRHGGPLDRDDDGRHPDGDAGGDRADRPDGHAACRWRDPRRARGGEVRHPLHPQHDEHLLDRGHRREHQGAVLVPALHAARPRLHGAAVRAGTRGQVQRPRPDARPADPRPAPQGPEERPDRAAQADAGQHPQPDDQAALVPGHAGYQTAAVWQHRRPRRSTSAIRRRCAAWDGAAVRARRSAGPMSSG